MKKHLSNLPIGQLLPRIFETGQGLEWFLGTVVRHDVSTPSVSRAPVVTFHLLYDDGDEEHLTLEQALGALHDYQRGCHLRSPEDVLRESCCVVPGTTAAADSDAAIAAAAATEADAASSAAATVSGGIQPGCDEPAFEGGSGSDDDAWGRVADDCVVAGPTVAREDPGTVAPTTSRPGGEACAEDTRRANAQGVEDETGETKKPQPWHEQQPKTGVAVGSPQHGTGPSTLQDGCLQTQQGKRGVITGAAALPAAVRRGGAAAPAAPVVRPQPVSLGEIVQKGLLPSQRVVVWAPRTSELVSAQVDRNGHLRWGESGRGTSLSAFAKAARRVPTADGWQLCSACTCGAGEGLAACSGRCKLVPMEDLRRRFRLLVAGEETHPGGVVAAPMAAAAAGQKRETPCDYEGARVDEVRRPRRPVPCLDSYF